MDLRSARCSLERIELGLQGIHGVLLGGYWTVRYPCFYTGNVCSCIGDREDHRTTETLDAEGGTARSERLHLKKRTVGRGHVGSVMGVYPCPT